MKKIGKKMLCAFLAVVLIWPFPVTDAFAAKSGSRLKKEERTTFDEKVDVLVDNGYSRGEVALLSEEDVTRIYEGIINGNVVDIYTCVIEIDNLAEIEAFYSCSKEELVEMGATEHDIDSTKEQLDQMYFMSDVELEREHGLSKTEAKLFRKAIDNGKSNCKSNQKYGKELKNYVGASGSITSSEMKYTQSILDFSPALDRPEYLVFLTYDWYKPYFLGVFDDEIVAAWGGGLNTRGETGSAAYYGYGTFGWTSYCVGNLAMETVVSPNKGIEFIFPQGDRSCKTKSGGAQFRLYQTKEIGYDTTLVSQYCHRVYSVKSANITISATDVGASIDITTAWDTTTQKRTKIGY